jgi:hypothetical protein
MARVFGWLSIQNGGLFQGNAGHLLGGVWNEQEENVTRIHGIRPEVRPPGFITNDTVRFMFITVYAL